VQPVDGEILSDENKSFIIKTIQNKMILSEDFKCQEIDASKQVCDKMNDVCTSSSVRGRRMRKTLQVLLCRIIGAIGVRRGVSKRVEDGLFRGWSTRRA
jgi:hypothetical protein